MTNSDSTVDQPPIPINEKVGFKDRIRAFREYRRASAELKGAWDRTARAFSEEILRDETGREIDDPGYIAGLRLGGRFSQEEAVEVNRDLVNMVSSRLGAFDDHTGPTLPLDQIGIIAPDLMCPIVDIPHVAFNPKGMSQMQRNDLAGLQRNVARLGSVMMQINLQHKDAKGGFGRIPGKLPEGIVIEDGTDYKLEIAFTPSFRNQRIVAEQVVKSVLDIPVITKRRTTFALPSGSPPAVLRTPLLPKG